MKKNVSKETIDELTQKIFKLLSDSPVLNKKGLESNKKRGSKTMHTSTHRESIKPTKKKKPLFMGRIEKN